MEKKPVPNYEKLKEEAETMDLRVRAFYSGCFEEYEMDSDDEQDDEEEDAEEENENTEKGTPAVLPLIENKDYLPMRKKIFLTSLRRK